MSDPNEIAALKASLRGAISTAESLARVRDTIESLDPHADVNPELLQDLARIASAHALASAALRGLVETMIRRRTPAA